MDESAHWDAAFTTALKEATDAQLDPDEVGQITGDLEQLMFYVHTCAATRKRCHCSLRDALVSRMCLASPPASHAIFCESVDELAVGGSRNDILLSQLLNSYHKLSKGKSWKFTSRKKKRSKARWLRRAADSWSPMFLRWSTRPTRRRRGRGGRAHPVLLACTTPA